jgi:predicted anti-sigma-YlaC factor YlaD
VREPSLRSLRPLLLPPLAVALVALAGAGCSPRRLALTGLADALAGGGGGVFASDDDPELVRDAAPFSLKTLEALLVELPDHEGLRLAACSGFAQYAYAFPQSDAELAETADYARAEALRDRARRLFVRGRDHCLHALERRRPGTRDALLRAPEGALDWAAPADVPLLYWTGAAWGSAIALGLDRPELVADLPAVRALLGRALALDEAWDQGAIHAALISFEAVPEAMGGSPARAREHFERAVALSEGRSAGPYVTYATAVARPAGDRAAFERLLGQALAVDPDADPRQRLANHVAQRRARFLLDHAAELVASAPAEGETP